MINIHILILEYRTNRLFFIEMVAKTTINPITAIIKATLLIPSRLNGAKIAVAAIGIDVLSPIIIDKILRTVLLRSLYVAKLYIPAININEVCPTV